MWLNDEKITDAAISHYRKSLINTCPHHVVIDNLFNQTKLDRVTKILQSDQHWKTQRHTYSALYVDDTQWQKTCNEQRFVQRDAWQSEPHNVNIADDFLSFLRADVFMSLLSRIFNVALTDINVEDPDVNTNYFRLGVSDFVEQHADDSPGREVCMLLYLNKDWEESSGGELVFNGQHNQPVSIAPLYNRCVLFDPFANGSEHWVKKLNAEHATSKHTHYRYNITSWYWSE